MTTITKESGIGFFAGTDIPFAVEPKDASGELHGEVVWNYESGVVKRVAVYEAGVLINEKWFYNDGVEKTPNDKSCGCVSSICEGVNIN